MADEARNSMDRPFPHVLPIGLFHLDPDPVPADPPADPTPGDPPDDPPRTFTQEDVDRIVRDRLARAKSTPPADYEDLKAAAARLAEIEEANKSDLEKALARAEQAENDREQVLAEAREIKIRSAVLAEAAKPDRKIVDPDLVATLLTPDLELDDDGAPTNIAEAMDALLEARPYLVAVDGGQRATSADQGARKGGAKQLSRESLKSMTPEEIEQARKDGRLDEVLRGR